MVECISKRKVEDVGRLRNGTEALVIRGLHRAVVGLGVPGTGRAFAVDPTGTYGSAVTDQGTFRFQLKAADPSKTVVKVTGTARDVEFGTDGTLYVMEAQKLSAIGVEGSVRWSQPLTDGRRMAVGIRPVVLDGTDKLVTFAPADGVVDTLAPTV